MRACRLCRRWAAGAALCVVLATGACTRATAGSGVAIDGPPPTNAMTSSTAPTTTAPTTVAPKKRVGSCAGATASIRAASLHAAILPRSPDHVPLNATASGTQPWAVLVHDTYRGVTGAAAFLQKVHYRGGYQNTWSKGVPGRQGRVTEFSTVYEFADSVDSCSFATWESKNLQLESARGLPGLTGNTSRVGSVKAFSTEFVAVKGRLVVISGSLVYGAKSGAQMSQTIIVQQYGRL